MSDPRSLASELGGETVFSAELEQLPVGVGGHTDLHPCAGLELVDARLS